MEFTLIKSRAMTLRRSPQYRAFSRAVMDEKLLSPLFPVGRGWGGGGAVVTNDWCKWPQKIQISLKKLHIMFIHALK